MIIRNFDSECVALSPLEADSPLVVNTDAVLIGAITLPFLQPIPRQNLQVLKALRAIEDQ